MILNPSQLSSARIMGSTSRLYYPSPFFDIASTYLPKNIKELFQWCRYYFLIHPIIHQCVTKMAEYPVTDVIIEDDDPRISNKWQELLNDKFDFKGFLITVGIDYQCMGNAYVGPLFPFVKYLTCQGCKEAFPANTIMEKWTFSNYSFTLECPKCKRRGKADAKDIYTKNIEKVKLFCWNPESVLVNGSEFGGSHYFYQVPSHVKNDWALGQKYKVVETPQEILDASQKSKIIILNKDNFIHLKRTASSSRDYEYGVPIMFPVLKDIFLLQIFKKATEALLLNHAVPLRVIFPQASSAAADPNAMVKLRTWRTEVEENLTRWRQDPSYISILPFPLGQETIGGDAKVFLIGGEMLQQMEMIVTEMGVPKEFIFGGTSYSGSNMSLKMLENTFVNYRLMLMRLTRFIISKLAAYTGWPKPKNVRFRNFKMADDLQRKMYFLQLNQMKKISDTTLLDDNDMSSEVEDARIEKEISRRRQSVKDQAIAEAEVQTEVQGMVQKHRVKTQMDLQKYQQRLQEEFNETLKPAQDIKGNVGNIMQRISGMAPEEQAKYMERLQAAHPDLAGIVTTMQEKMKATGQGESLMQPMPEVLPPRRLAQ